MKIAISFLFFLFFSVLAPVAGWALAVNGVAVERSGKAEVIVFALDAAAPHHAFLLQNPTRLVVDLPPFAWQVSEQQLAGLKSNLVKGIRYARFDANTSRLVLDIQQPVVFREENGEKNQKRFVLTATDEVQSTPAKAKAAEGNLPWLRRGSDRVAVPPTVTPSASANERPLPTSKKRENRRESEKPLVVIDAGHGGKDPGARGVGGTREKEVTLRYARALRDSLRNTGLFRAELTRDSDKIIPLRDRFRIARGQKADIFISLHADSAPNHDASGLSVYSLSETASDVEAAALAKQENNSDTLLDMDLTHEDEEVADILIDLARRDTKNKSVQLAEKVVGAMKGRVTMLPNAHRHAGFAVLKAPDIPSILVEIGFLTNAQEEKRINTVDHEEKVVDGLTRAITNYFAARR